MYLDDFYIVQIYKQFTNNPPILPQNPPNFTQNEIPCKIKDISTESLYLRPYYLFGGLAQLARALDWQSRGHRFDSDILHKKRKSKSC